MSDFGSWFSKQKPAYEPPELPEGITECDGAYFAECCVCGKRDELPVSVYEIPFYGYEHYCGGSPRCCP